MKKLVRSHVVWYGVAISLIYFALAFTVNRTMLFAVLNGVFLGVTVCVVAVYWPLFWRSIRELPFTRTSHLAMGIGLVWVAMTISRLISIFLRHSHPRFSYDAALNNPLIGYVGLLAILGGIFHVTGAGIDPSGKFTRGRNFLVICVVLGAMVSGLAVALQLPGSKP